ncbi:MAG: hypothetical protein AAF629_13490 [Chloroflexota bacterium]
MVKVNRSNWPIVYLEVDGITTLAAMEEYVAEMEIILEFAEQQSDKFGMVYITDMSDDEFKSRKREKEAHKLSKAWLKENKPRLEASCVGIAMVTQATGMMKIMRPVAKRTMKRMMGAPGDMFFTKEEAETWMQEQMAAAN